jgi:hypothetical protein
LNAFTALALDRVRECLDQFATVGRLLRDPACPPYVLRREACYLWRVVEGLREFVQVLGAVKTGMDRGEYARLLAEADQLAALLADDDYWDG